MRTAIYGAGSLGTILGAYITKGGESIDLINRNAAHIAALKENGACVTGTVSFTQKVSAITPDEMTGKYDIIFLLTKQQHNREVLNFLKPFLADNGAIVTMQNGIPELLASEIMGEERVIGCTVAWGATMKSPGTCELTSQPDSLTFSIGTMTEKRHKHFSEVKRLLEMMGTAEVEENFLGTRWSKLLINAAFSGVSTCMGCTFGEAAANRKSRRIIQNVIKECIDVCKASGIRIEPVQGKDIVRLLDYSNPVKKAISFFIIPIAIRKHARLKASMLQDIENGKPTEIDAINGIVCESGKKAGVPTPANDAVVRVIRQIEQGKLKPEPANADLF